MHYTNVIISIDRCLASDMPDVLRTSSRVIIPMDAIPWIPIPIKVPASLNISDKLDNGQRIYSAQLAFKTPSDYPRERMVYRATAVNGKQYLIGTRERPFPVTSVVEPHPDRITDNQLLEVTVTFSSAYKILYIAG